MENNNFRLHALHQQAIPLIERRLVELMEAPRPVPILVDWNSLAHAKEKEARALLLYLERILDNLEWLAYDEVSRTLLNNRLSAIRIRHVHNSLENSVSLMNGNLITLANFSEPEEMPSAVEIRRVLSRGLTFPIDG